jgi:hypothetical protein
MRTVTGWGSLNTPLLIKPNRKKETLRRKRFLCCPENIYMIRKVHKETEMNGNTEPTPAVFPEKWCFDDSDQGGIQQEGREKMLDRRTIDHSALRAQTDE